MTLETFHFADDGGIPNSPLPVLATARAAPRPERDPVAGEQRPIVEQRTRRRDKLTRSAVFISNHDAPTSRQRG